MGGFKQIQNAKGAFGYTPDGQLSGRGALEVEDFWNASSVQVIPIGAAVITSTVSADGKAVTITTVAGSPLFMGVAITSASTCTDPTIATSLQPQAAWLRVATNGLVPGALLTSGTVAGDFVGTVNSTVAGSTGGGYLGTIVSTQVAGAFFGVAGFAYSSGTTGTTPPLTATGPRGTVRLQKSVIPGSTL